MTSSRQSWLAVGAVLALLVVATGTSLATPLDSVPTGALGTFWYTLEVLGSRGGYSQQSLARIERDGASWLESTEHTVVRLKMDGRVLTATRDEIRRYDQELRLVFLQHSSNQFGRQTQVTAQREGDVLKVHKRDPAGATTQDLPLPEDFGQELRALADLGAGAMTRGQKYAFSTYDTELGALDRVEMTVTERVEPPQAGWKLETRSGLLKVHTLAWVTDQGVMVRQQVPDLMNLSLHLADEQEALTEASPLLLSSSVPVAKALGTPTGLRTVQLQVRSRVGAAEGLFPVTHRQTVRANEAGVVLTVKADVAPPLTVRRPIADPELTPYLAASDMAQSADPAIRERVQTVLGQETDAWQSVCRLREWVYTTLRKVDSEPRPISALEVLQQKRGDCTEHAVLMAALCQAAGIPVKMVAGLAYDNQAFHYHAWNEVYVGQWVEVDATWNEAVVDAGHLQVAAAALDSTSLSRMSLASGRTMGTIELEVLDHEITR